MATQLAVGDLLEVAIVCKADEQYGLNVRHYDVTSVGGNPITVEDVAATIEGEFETAYKVALSSGATYWGVKATRIKPTRSQPAKSFVSRGPGDVAEDLLPRQVAGVIKLKTEVGGRTGRGRAYIPFLPETYNDPDGNPEGAAITALQGIGNLLDDTFPITVGARTGTIRPVLYNRKTGARTPVDGFVVRSRWGSQRRRSNINRPDADPLGE